MKKRILLFSLVFLFCTNAIFAEEHDALAYFQFVDATDSLFEDKVEIRWSLVPFDAITYRVLRNDTLLSLASSEDSLYVDFTGVPGIEYEYCVVMTDTLDPSILDTLCDNGSRVIFPPGSVEASDGLFEDKISISWDDRSAVEQGYIIFRNDVPVGSGGGIVFVCPHCPIGTTAANTEFYLDTTVVVNSVYHYEVVAFDADGYKSKAVADSGFRAIILPPLLVSATDGLYSDRVLITWIDQTEREDGYIIFRNDVPVGSGGGIVFMCSYCPVDTMAADCTSFTDFTAMSGSTYTYCVASLDANDDTSIHVCDQGGIGILPGPENVEASNGTFDDRVELTWEVHSDLQDGFIVKRDGDTLVVTSRWDASYTDKTANPNQPYTYCVQAFSDSGGVSADICVSGKRAIIVTPTKISATDGDFEEYVEITWESISTTAVLFEIHRDGTLIKTVPAKSRSYRDYGGTVGENYDYSVTPVTANDIRPFMIPLDTGYRKLNPPTQVQASDNEFENRVEISWVDNSMIENGFYIVRSYTGLGVILWEALDTIPSNRTSFIDMTGTPGLNYTYHVAVFDTIGEDWGSSEYEHDSGGRILNAPSDVQATDGEYEDQIEITWKDNSRAEWGYKIYRKEAESTADSVVIDSTTANVNSFTDNTTSTSILEFCVNYAYFVCAYDSFGTSAPDSNEGSTDILPPSSVNASDTYTDEVVVTWIDNSVIEDGYLITGDNMPGPFSVGANITSITDNSPSAGGNYCVRSFTGGVYSEVVCDVGSIAEVPQCASFLQELDDKLISGDVAVNDRFGNAISISGDSVAIIGAAWADVQEVNDGAAYIFRRKTNGTWEQEEKLFNAESPLSYDYFGKSVSICGDRAIVGVPQDTDCWESIGCYSDVGKAYIFERENFEWTLIATLEAEFDGKTPAPWDNFGSSVAISGDYAVIGSPGENSEWGAAYIVQRNPNTNTWEFTNRYALGGPGDRFGCAVAIDGNYALIGAEKDDETGNDAGAAYIFRRDWTTWELDQKLTVQEGDVALDFLGHSVAISGDLAIIGAYGEHDSRGAAYIFERDAVNWIKRQTLIPSNYSGNCQFGEFVSISGDVALVGAPLDNNNDFINSGSAYLFKRDAYDLWQECANLKLFAKDGTAHDLFGSSVAISGDIVFIGARDNDFYGSYTGSAYVFDLSLAASASDGTFKNRVQIKWKDQSFMEEGFRIYRDDLEDPIAEVESNVQIYDDFEAQPGRTYEYCVVTFNEQLGEFNKECDFGWRPPNGNITGRITTSAGSGVDSVDVCLDPSPNTALLFDGVGGLIHVPHDEAINFNTSDDYTIECWIKYSGNGGSYPWSAIIQKWTDSSRLPYSLNVHNGCFAFGFSYGVFSYAKTDDINLNDNTWHHIACVYNRNGTSSELLIYVDGDLEVDSFFSFYGDISNEDDLYFGSRNIIGGTENYYRGQLDEVRIWKRIRTREEIVATMYQSLTGEEKDLVGYWPFDADSGTVVITDMTANSNYGTLEKGVYWTDDSAPINACATTDKEGNYTLANIRYGDLTTFQVTPSKRNGKFQFNPAFKDITLSTGNPVWNEVGFIDESMYTVSGKITFLGYGCPVPNVTIYVTEKDGVRSPRGTTDENGEYAISLENGTYQIEAEFMDHEFDTTYTNVRIKDYDISEINFIDTTTRTLYGRVAGGCSLYIGQANLQIFSDNGCIETDIWANPTYEICLPSQKYYVWVENVIVDPAGGLSEVKIKRFFSRLGGKEVDLTSVDDTLDFIYRAPLRVEIHGLPDVTCDNLGVPILAQGDQVPLVIRVYEKYGNDDEDLCPVDSGMVRIYDEIIDEEDTPKLLPIQYGEVGYETAANTPNTAIGRVVGGIDRSYQKALTVVAEVEGLDPVEKTAWVIVTGHCQREGTDFVSGNATAQPILILRDPPGDNSYSYFEEGYQISYTTDYDIGHWMYGGGLELELKMGIKFQKGFIIMDETLFRGVRDIGFMKKTYSNRDMTTVQSFASTERFSTSSSENFVGGDNDLFIGKADNFLFAVVDVIDIEDCIIAKSKSIGFQPDSIQTLYVYSGWHIKNVLIPRLFEIKQIYVDSGFVDEGIDSVDWCQSHIDAWQKDHLDFNDSLKSVADIDTNISFSAGAEYEYSHATSTTERYSRNKTIWTEMSEHAGFEWGQGGNVSKLIGTGVHEWVHIEDLKDTTKVSTSAFGYVLSDDDIGDYFTVDVKHDGRYQGPIFDVRAGASSCPWEPWLDSRGDARMVPRDGIELTADTYEQHGIPPDQPAVFTLFMTNKSQSGEIREYILRELNRSNKYGAIIRANGNPIGPGGLSFFLDHEDAHQVTLTVSRGPNYYHYDSLAVYAYPACEYPIWENGGPLQKADTLYLQKVYFEALCSDITLYKPLSGWNFNYADQDTGRVFSLTLCDYELNISDDPKDAMQEIGAEYRCLGTGLQGPSGWQLIHIIPNTGDNLTKNCDENEKDCETSIVFDIPDVLEDGVYEIRAYTKCPGGYVYSAVSTGTIDRNPPQVFETPQPADGILSYGENISITFNEPIARSSIHPDSTVVLTYTSGGTIPINTVLNDRTILLTPNEGYTDLENSSLTAIVDSVRDLLGNPLVSDTSWTFTVNYERFAWSQSNLTLTVARHNPGSFSAELVNGIPDEYITYDLTEHPEWLTPDIFSGEFTEPGAYEITFAVQETLSEGTHIDSVKACARLGPGDACTYPSWLIVNFTVECRQPTWEVNSSDFFYSMNITTALHAPGGEEGTTRDTSQISIDTNDMVAAYVGNELRGVAHLDSIRVGNQDRYLAFVTVYSNIASGEMVRFRVWNDAECRIHPYTSESFIFEADVNIGNPVEPETLHAVDGVVEKLQTIPFNDGWTWFSTRINALSMTPAGIFSPLQPVAGDMIKSPDDDVYSQFDPVTGWVGTLLELDNVSGYMVRLSEGGILDLIGPPALPSNTGIELHSGWNWISYLPWQDLEVGVALYNLSGDLVNGDLLKSQDAFAQYIKLDGQLTGTWYGSLQEMRPGFGYKIKLQNTPADLFFYPDSLRESVRIEFPFEPTIFAGASDVVTTGLKGLAGKKGSQNGPGWSVDPHAYQYNMTVTGVLEIDGVESRNEGNIIGAFVEGECRGVAQPQHIEQLDRYLVFLMVHSNDVAGEPITFKVFDAEDEVIRPVDETLTFSADATHGSVAEPFVFNAGSVLSIEEARDMLIPDEYGLAQNYPNPFNLGTDIRYQIADDRSSVHTTLRIYNMLGQEVRVLVEKILEPGYYTATWNGRDEGGSEVASGVYFYKLSLDGGQWSETKRMVLMK